MIEEERTKVLTRDKVILDSSSGNTGIAYALIGGERLSCGVGGAA
jgi:cysteine synthase B